MKVPFLKMEKIHKFYGSVHALKGVDFDVGQNEVVGLVGENGAGKSTLVGIIAGTIPKTSGEIYMKGEEVEINSVEDARRLGIEVLHQMWTVIETMSVAQNIFLGREPLKSGLIKLVEKGKMRNETEKLIESLELSVVSPDQEVRFCSGGDRQGVAISRTIYFKAELVVLDEPTASLPISGVQRVLDFIRQLKKAGPSAVVISHNLFHVYPVADRIVVLSRGEKIADLKKEETSIGELGRLIAGHSDPYRLSH